MAAVVLTEPGTAKAAVSGSADMVHLTFPIEKRQDTETINPLDGTPDLLIWGKASDGTLDSDLQIVDPDWSMKALREWFDTKANVRMQHDPKQPVGKGVDIDGHYVKSLICDPKAKYFIRQGVLNDYSVGIMNPEVRRVGDPAFRHLDPQGKAIGGIVTGRTDGSSKIGELTVCDRGANYGASFAIAKAAADGSLMLVDELTGPDDMLTKAAEPAKDSGLTSVELPSDMKLKVTPAVLAKMATLKRNLVLAEQEMKAATPDVINKAAEFDDDPQPEFLATKAAEAAVYKRDIDTATRRRLASEGHALPNLSYPIENEGDLENAATLARSGHGDVAAATALIGREARARGIPNPMKKPKVKKAAKSADPDDKLGQCPTCKGRGFVKKPANTKCEACGGSGRATGKAATPDVAKCMKCDGSGMFEDKPCPDCKDKAAAPGVAKKKGKMRAICPNCGAKQNPDHKHCPECGNALPARALQVKKNHDFVCLHCGHELDKGEPHCPECGKENPGYLPEADRKIPANLEADKSAGKDRVAKAKKKSGKKGMPFGGNQAKPFGAEDEKDEPGKAEKRRKGKGKGRSPAEGVKGHETMPLPPHREPDGAPVEQFENDAHLEDGDQEMKTALRHKSLAMDPSLAVIHDLTCPAFSPASVSKALPHASFAGIDASYWQQEALKATGEPDIIAASAMYNEMAALGRAAITLKTADPQLLHDLRTEHHRAFLEANKTFRDATPGPGAAPTPGHVMPGSFQRPYLSAGHAAESPQAEPARTFPVITDHPAAQDYQRGYLSGGHASQSPDNASPQHMPDMRPSEAGAPHAVPYAGTTQENADHSLSTMHDHISRRFPDVCPMSPAVGEGQKPAPHPVPEAVGGPVPHGAKASKAEKAAAKARAAKKAARVAARKAAAQRRKLGERVLKGRLSPEEAQARLGITAKAAVPSPVSTSLPGDVTYETPQAPLDADALKAALKAATAPLVKRIERQDKALRKNAKVLDAVANRADTSEAPFRGAGVWSANKASAAAAPPQTVAEAAALAQNTKLRALYSDWRNNPDPNVREQAWPEIQKMLGTNSPDGPTQPPVPYTPR